MNESLGFVRLGRLLTSFELAEGAFCWTNLESDACQKIKICYVENLLGEGTAELRTVKKEKMMQQSSRHHPRLQAIMNCQSIVC